MSTTPNPETPQTPEAPEPYVAWPPATVEDAVEELLEKHGYYDRDSNTYGRMTAPLVRQLARIGRQTATPERFIKTTGPVTGKPYDSTGLASIQPQVEMANAIYGEPHWRWWPVPSADNDGTYSVTLLIGNDLHHIQQVTVDGEIRAQSDTCEVLIAHTLLGSNPNGSTPANKMKGALTNAGKRLLATVGCCGDVYRFDGDSPEDGLQPDTGSTGTARRSASGSGSPSENQLSYLLRLLRNDAGQDLVRMRGLIGRMATVADVPAPELLHGGEFEKTARQLAKDHLAKGQVGEIIEGLKTWAENGGRANTAPATTPPAPATPSGSPQPSGPSPTPSAPATPPPPVSGPTSPPPARDSAEVQRQAPQSQPPSGLDPAEQPSRNGHHHDPVDFPG